MLKSNQVIVKASLSMSPIPLLPTEILEKIIYYACHSNQNYCHLGMYNILDWQTACTISVVSKQFSRITQPLIFKRLSLKTPNIISNLVNKISRDARISNYVEELRISTDDGTYVWDPDQVLSSLPNLQVLYVKASYRKKDRYSVERGPFLLNCQHPQITTLFLIGKLREDLLVAPNILSSFPNLKQLHLRHENSSELALDDFRMPELCKALSQLDNLELFEYDSLGEIFSEYDVTKCIEGDYWSRLHSLKLWESHSLGYKGCEAIVRHFGPQLKVLSLSSTNCEFSGSWVNLFDIIYESCGSSIQHLFLAYFDQQFEGFLAKTSWPFLRSFKFFCPKSLENDISPVLFDKIQYNFDSSCMSQLTSFLLRISGGPRKGKVVLTFCETNLFIVVHTMSVQHGIRKLSSVHCDFYDDDIEQIHGIDGSDLWSMQSDDTFHSYDEYDDDFDQYEYQYHTYSEDDDLLQFYYSQHMAINDEINAAGEYLSGTDGWEDEDGIDGWVDTE